MTTMPARVAGRIMAVSLLSGAAAALVATDFHIDLLHVYLASVAAMGVHALAVLINWDKLKEFLRVS